MFWILGSVFGFWEVFCPYEPPYKKDPCIELFTHNSASNLTDQGLQDSDEQKIMEK